MEALEGQVSRLESVRRDMEHKLTSMYSSLRRVAGIRLDGAGGGGQSWRPSSPAARRTGLGSARGQSGRGAGQVSLAKGTWLVGLGVESGFSPRLHDWGQMFFVVVERIGLLFLFYVDL